MNTRVDAEQLAALLRESDEVSEDDLEARFRELDELHRSEEYSTGVEASQSVQRQPLEWVDDLEPVLTSGYLIKGLLDVGAMSLVFGPPGSAKMLFTMDMAFHLAPD